MTTPVDPLVVEAARAIRDTLMVRAESKPGLGTSWPDYLAAAEAARSLVERDVRERIANAVEAIETRQAQPGHTYSGVALPPLRPFDDYLADVRRVVRDA